jgi:hypothetical protein
MKEPRALSADMSRCSGWAVKSSRRCCLAIASLRRCLGNVAELRSMPPVALGEGSNAG